MYKTSHLRASLFIRDKMGRCESYFSSNRQDRCFDNNQLPAQLCCFGISNSKGINRFNNHCSTFHARLLKWTPDLLQNTMSG